MYINPNLQFLYENRYKYRTFVLQGGARAGKSYSVCHFLLNVCRHYSGYTISIVRKTFPALKATIMRDFIEIMDSAGLYDQSKHNKSDHEIKFNGNLIEFFSIDDHQKVRGRKRDILFINEATELSLDEYRQLALRTSGKIIMDYNPSENDSYIYNEVIPCKDAGMLITTYRDNPHLSDVIVNEIERYQTLDLNYWRVYGMGQRGISNTTIYTHWKEWHNKMPEDINIFYGLDFGFNNPTAMVKIYMGDRVIYAEEVLYRSGMTNSDLIQWMRTDSVVPDNAIIYADCAEPQRIEEIKQAGYRGVKPANKSVEDGINRVKAYPLYINVTSTNFIQELRNYKWMVDKNGSVLDTPVKTNDHLCDALRYGVHTHLLKPKGEYLQIIV